MSAVLTIILMLVMTLLQIAIILRYVVTMHSGKNHYVHLPFHLEKIPENFLFLATAVFGIIIIPLTPDGIELFLMFSTISAIFACAMVVVMAFVEAVGHNLSKKQYFRQVYRMCVLMLRYIGLSPVKIYAEIIVTINDDRTFIAKEVTRHGYKENIYKFTTISRFFITKIIVDKDETYILDILHIYGIKMRKNYDSYSILTTRYKFTTCLLNFMHKNSGKIYYTYDLKIHRIID